MADVAIRAADVTAAPKDYKVPGAQEILPKSVTAHMDGTSASTAWLPCLQVLDPAGNVMFSAVPTSLLAVGVSADVSWFPHLTPQTPSTPNNAGVTLEQFFVDSTSSGVTSSTVLTAGTSYVVIVQGTFSIYNAALGFGTPEAEAMFPDSHAGRVSTQVGRDADTVFADEFAGTYPSNMNMWQINLGSGYAYTAPVGGPFSSPQTNHLYRYNVVGQGSAASFRVNDSPLTDNYGKLQVTIQGTTGSGSGGGGAGSLLPPAGADYAILSELSGVPLWTTFDGGSA